MMTELLFFCQLHLLFSLYSSSMSSTSNDFLCNLMWCGREEREHKKEFYFVVEKLIKVSQHELQLITRCCLFYSFDDDGEKKFFLQLKVFFLRKIPRTHKKVFFWSFQIIFYYFIKILHSSLFLLLTNFFTTILSRVW